MGAFAAAVGALDPRPRCAAREPGARGGPASDLRVLPAARAGHRRGGRALRRGDIRAALWRRPQPQRPLPLRCPRRRVVREGSALRFAAVRPPTDEEAETVLLRIARRLDRLL